MLLPKPFAENDVVSIKLMSGEEILCRYKGEDANVFHITKPLNMALMQVPGSPGQGAVGFAPWLLGADMDAQIHIPKTAVMAMCKALKQAVAQYIKHTSGLDIPIDTGIITGKNDK